MKAACLDRVGDVREAVSDGVRQLEQAVRGEEEVQPGLCGEEGQRGGAKWE